MKKITARKVKYLLCISIILAVFIVSGKYFFSSKLFDTHDLEYHAARVANYYLALRDYQVPPRWSGNLNYSFGLPTFIFAYPVPYFFSALLFSLTKSIQLSINIYLLLAWMSGGLGMYLLAINKTKNEIYSIIVSLVYISAPYTLLNFFERGAFGEIAFFSLIPYIFLLAQKQKYIKKPLFLGFFYFISVLFLLSHPQSIMIFAPVFLAWYLTNFDLEIIKRNLKAKILLLISILLTVQFFWIPMIFEAKYTAIKQAIDSNELFSSFPIFSKLFFPSTTVLSSYANSMLETSFDTTIGISILIPVILSFFMIKISSKRKALLPWIFTAIASIIMMHPISSHIWKLSGPFLLVQFPWRLLSLVVISGCMLLIEFFALKNINKIKTIVAVILLLLSFGNLLIWGKPKAYISRSNYEWLEYFGTASSFDEFVPINFDQGKNNLISEKVVISSLEKGDPVKSFSEENVSINEWKSSSMKYWVSIDRPSVIIQKTAFFPGWKVFVDGLEEKVITSDMLPGRIMFEVLPGEHEVFVTFTEDTKPRLIGDFLSIVGFVLFLSIVIKSFVETSE